MSRLSYVDQSPLFLRQIIDLAKSQEQKLNQILVVQRKQLELQQQQIDQLPNFQEIQKQHLEMMMQIKDAVQDLCKKIPTRDDSNKVCEEENSFLLRESKKGKQMDSLAVLSPEKDDDIFHHESIFTDSLPKPPMTTPYSFVEPSSFQVHESKCQRNKQQRLRCPKQIDAEPFHQPQDDMDTVNLMTFEYQGSSQQRDSNLALSDHPVFQSKSESAFQIPHGIDASQSKGTLKEREFQKPKDIFIEPAITRFRNVSLCKRNKQMVMDKDEYLSCHLYSSLYVMPKEGTINHLCQVRDMAFNRCTYVSNIYDLDNVSGYQVQLRLWFGKNTGMGVGLRLSNKNERPALDKRPSVMSATGSVLHQPSNTYTILWEAHRERMFRKITCKDDGEGLLRCKIAFGPNRYSDVTYDRYLEPTGYVSDDCIVMKWSVKVDEWKYLEDE